MRISDWSSDVCSSDLDSLGRAACARGGRSRHTRGGQTGQIGHDRMHRTDDDPRLTAASIATNILSGLCLMAEEQDIACEHWFTGLRPGRAQVDDASVRVSYRQARPVLHRALQLGGASSRARVWQYV